MRAAKPDELKENALPVMTAQISESELLKWFPVAFHDITDPWATPEPSKGALIKLDAGEYVVVYWGHDSKELTVNIPAATDASAVLASLFREVPIPRSRVLWRRSDARLPRYIAAKTVSAAGSRTTKKRSTRRYRANPKR
jgi:hypothetical protein